MKRLPSGTRELTILQEGNGALHITARDSSRTLSAVVANGCAVLFRTDPEGRLGSDIRLRVEDAWFEDLVRELQAMVERYW